jgi:integrase
VEKEGSRLIDLENRVIRIPRSISKTKRSRQIKIRNNLYALLKAFPGEIIPKNFDGQARAIRKKFALTPDVLRHTFITAHVMAFGSFAETAIESGNSEKIIRDHYFNSMPKSEADKFWLINPHA